MMAQDCIPSENAKVSPAAVHKGFGLAVPAAQWYIALCKPTRERTVRDSLLKAGYEAYVASQKAERVYKSRNRRIVERVVLSGVVFVRTSEAQLLNILQQFSAVHRFMLNRAAAPDARGRQPFASVPQTEMESLMALLEKSEMPVAITDAPLRLDQEVRIVAGPLAGFRGRFYREGPATYVVIKVEIGTQHYAYTEVALKDIQPVAQAQEPAP